MNINSKKSLLSLSIFFGFFAGVCAVLILGEYQFNNWYLERLASDSDNGFSNIIIQSPERVEVAQNLRIEEVFKQAKPAMASIYRKKSVGKDVISQIYKREDFLGYGVILTSDGWIVSASDVFKNLNADQIVVVYDHTIKDVLEKIFDSVTNTFLLKINEVDLPVIKFGFMDSLSVGSQMLAINNEEVRLTNLSNMKYASDVDLLRSSEKYYNHFLLSSGNIAVGSAIVSFQGDFVGMVVDSDEQDFSKAVPIDFLQKSVNLVLRGEKISHPYLGVNYLDIASSVGLNKQAAKGLEAGALLYGRGSSRAINSDSPLFGLLLEGDIITKVGNYEIDSRHNLTEFILSSKKGDVVDFEYVREAGKREVVKIELK
jgi:S1-C subfamily serine protease